MHAAADSLEFTPPRPPGMLRAFGLAMLAHLLLLGALTWGVHWKRQSDTIAVEAELWSALPQQAAPRPVELPAAEPAKPAPPKAAPPVRDAEIALQRDKKRLEQEQRKNAAEEKKKQELEASRKEALKAQEEAKKLAAQRQENLKRIAGLAGATGEATATGSAQQSSGPSQGYAGRIRARIKPNIVFTDDIAGNPTAELEVRAAPDGTIVSRKLLKSSGVKSWDEAVLRAIDKTEVLPRDVDGRVPSALVISFRPKD